MAIVFARPLLFCQLNLSNQQHDVLQSEWVCDPPQTTNKHEHFLIIIQPLYEHFLICEMNINITYI